MLTVPEDSARYRSKLFDIFVSIYLALFVLMSIKSDKLTTFMSSSTFGKGDAFLGTLVLFLREISSPYHDQVEKDGFSSCGCPFLSLAPLYFFSATPFFLAPTVIWGSLNSSGLSCSKPD